LECPHRPQFPRNAGAADAVERRPTGAIALAHPREPSNEPEHDVESFRAVIAIGASAGGIVALQRFVAGLDPAMRAPILVVQHIGPHPSILPELLTRTGTLPALQARDGDELRPGRILVAPPDHHMVVQHGAVRLSRGAKEHHTRPAIDPLFRSVALAYGPRAIGVVMTGWGEDGTAGLQAIKACGGRVFVQQPAEAEQPDMPMTALHYVAVDRLFGIDGLGRDLAEAVAAREEAHSPMMRPGRLVHEHQSFLMQGDPMEHLNAIGRPSPYSCPDCYGGLWEIDGAKPRRFRCHTGHAYTLRTLQEAQAGGTDTALWNALRGLEEKEMLLREVASQYLQEGNAAEAARLEVLAHSVCGNAALLRELLEREDAAATPAAQSRAG
jgi:two-component system chemotaxis response regulator CheB